MFSLNSKFLGCRHDGFLSFLTHRSEVLMKSYVRDYNIFYENKKQHSFTQGVTINYTSHVKPLLFEGATFTCPHFSKLEKGGEDAIFLHEKYLGVADGVGSWMSEGIDPGLHSRELLYHVQKELGLAVEPADLGEYYALSLTRHLQNKEQAKMPINDKKPEILVHHPMDILEIAYNKTMSKGSSTCSLVFLDPLNRQAIGLNLGDSGYIIFRGRDLEAVCKSTPQHHQHNMPYQLGFASADRPQHALMQTVNLERGDWIVVATDGLWDNLYDNQIQEILLKVSTPAEAAREIGESAFYHCMDELWDSPFSRKEKKFQINRLLNGVSPILQPKYDDTSLEQDFKHAAKFFKDTPLLSKIQRIRGGKPDDISLIVVKVV